MLLFNWPLSLSIAIITTEGEGHLAERGFGSKVGDQELRYHRYQKRIYR